jgi:hypothetical protein
VPTGYRKVAGDTCEGGVDHFPMKIPCPGIRIISNSNIVYVGVIGNILFYFRDFGYYSLNGRKF